ncbi:hypothetical protein GIB67_017060 [Kingdonia uniflora]|uniref:F-box/LRR-repeat protein 15/At3g58940/PEG3-like LRR domain-containing protein n=1 Tax=Kingdonia uniflora TaxID=39325 RepID=A0A7J7NCI1_9MAGN|nr:hypothetical protein GIB67_017060 [Kingdonia uniflora]
MDEILLHMTIDGQDVYEPQQSIECKCIRLETELCDMVILGIANVETLDIFIPGSLVAARMRIKKAKICSSSKKKPRIKDSRENDIDRLSQLQDDLILQILSCDIDLKDVVKTSALSKRWKCLWTRVPNLFIGTNSSYGYSQNSISFVDHSLSLYQRPVVESFYLCSELCFEFLNVEKYEEWIRFALKKKVQHLFLYLGRANVMGELYTLPAEIFQCPSLSSLVVATGKIKLPDSFCSSLKKIFLYQVTLDKRDLIDKMMSNCPNLEHLDLFSCLGPISLHMSSSVNPRMQHLGVCFCDIKDLEIDAPNLNSLRIEGIFAGRTSLKNVASLARAFIGFKGLVDSGPQIWGYALYKLYENVQHVRDLTINETGIQVFSLCASSGFQTPTFKCKCLRLETELCDMVIPGIANILRNSNNVETLDIYIPRLMEAYGLADYRSAGDNWFGNEPPFHCLENNVKIIVITIQGKKVGLMNRYVEYANMYDKEANLVQFLLKSALVLEELKIYIKDPGLENERLLRQVARTIRRFPRASSRAKVSIKYKDFN